MLLRVLIILLYLKLSPIDLIRAQSPILSFTSSYVPAASSVSPYTLNPAPNSGSFNTCASTLYDYSFSNTSNNALRMSGIIANSKNYFVESITSSLRLRRVNNANVTGQRSIIFLETTIGPATACPADGLFNFKSAYEDQMEIFLNNILINQGTDNIFTNQGNADGNNNNIERVDVIFPSGISSSSAADAGFVFIDRGDDNDHDEFRIAAILGLDGTGNPSAFGPVVSCTGGNGANNGSWGHPTLANGNINLSAFVTRKEQGETYLRASAAKNQQLGGVFFTFQDLGVAADQIIYGYALLGPDGMATPTSAQLLNINDAAVYPTNTTELVGGGLDLIAVNALFSTGGVILKNVNIELYAARRNDNIIVDWSVEEVESLINVELQRSKDGLHFTTIYSGGAKARFIDHSKGNELFYRLKINLPDNVFHYSKTFRLNAGREAEVMVYPSLLRPGQNLTVKGLKEKRYKVMISSMDGRTIFRNVFINNGQSSFTIPQSRFSKGLHLVTFTSESGILCYSTKVKID